MPQGVPRHFVEIGSLLGLPCRSQRALRGFHGPHKRPGDGTIRSPRNGLLGVAGTGPQG
jgi:hypothetical protein